MCWPQELLCCYLFSVYQDFKWLGVKVTHRLADLTECLLWSSFNISRDLKPHGNAGHSQHFETHLGLGVIFLQYF